LDIHHSIEDFKCNSKTIVTIGTFDGVHQGHMSILEYLINTAKKEKKESVLLTFTPHPRNVLFPEGDDLKLLNSQKEKAERMKKIGLQHLIFHEFTKDFSRISPVNFIRDILLNKLNMGFMVVGYDHHFGRNREGSFLDLKEYAKLYSFKLKKISPYTFDETEISSTKIRNALLAGDIEIANKFLGYPYMFSGKVVHGDKIGREIGFPTANIQVDNAKLLPKHGVYAVKVELVEGVFFGMLNISDKTLKIEVNIFNFSQEIYDCNIVVRILNRLRDEKEIGSLEDLKMQLIKDKNKCMKLLNLF
jgi:riboflavin kinase/FMN adenylyltransferase